MSGVFGAKKWCQFLFETHILVAGSVFFAKMKKQRGLQGGRKRKWGFLIFLTKGILFMKNKVSALVALFTVLSVGNLFASNGGQSGPAFDENSNVKQWLSPVFYRFKNERPFEVFGDSEKYMEATKEKARKRGAGLCGEEAVQSSCSLNQRQRIRIKHANGSKDIYEDLSGFNTSSPNNDEKKYIPYFDDPQDIDYTEHLTVESFGGGWHPGGKTEFSDANNNFGGDDS